MNVDWLASLSPWPADGFGLERMHALLTELGDPQLAYEAVHVVGTNGKSTATKVIEALLLADGLHVGATVSPHVRSLVRADHRSTAGELAAREPRSPTCARPQSVSARRRSRSVTTAGARSVRRSSVTLPSSRRVSVAASTPRRRRSRVALATTVSLEHHDVLGESLDEIAQEKLAVAHAGSIVVLPDNRYADLVSGYPILVGGARTAAEAFVGHAIKAEPAIRLPGRLERRPREIRDGAHNPAGARWLAETLRPERFVLVASILEDKDVDAMLAELTSLGDTLVATSSSNPRALTAEALARRAAPYFDRVEAVSDPRVALGAGARATLPGARHRLALSSGRPGWLMPTARSRAEAAEHGGDEGKRSAWRGGVRARRRDGHRRDRVRARVYPRQGPHLTP